MSTDTSTIPVTIGLDVLEALINMSDVCYDGRISYSDPEAKANEVMLTIAQNAANAAREPKSQSLADILALHQSKVAVAAEILVDDECTCASCQGLNTSCPTGCGRDVTTGELAGPTIVYPDINTIPKNGYSDLMVMKSAAGFYVGTYYRDCEFSEEGFLCPGSRDSGYFATAEEAAKYIN